MLKKGRWGVAATIVTASLLVPYLFYANLGEASTSVSVPVNLASIAADAASGLNLSAGGHALEGNPSVILSAPRVALPLDVPNPNSVDSIDISLSFAGDLNAGQALQAGARDPNGNISWVGSLDLLRNGLSDLNETIGVDGNKILLVSSATPQAISSGARVAMNGLKGASPSPDELLGISGFPSARREQPLTTQLQTSTAGLRGDLLLQFETPKGHLDLPVVLGDLNLVAGADTGKFTLRRLDGLVLNTVDTHDDGNFGTNKVRSKTEVTLALDFPEDAWYTLEWKPSGSDLVIDRLAWPEGAVFSGKVAVGGQSIENPQQLPIQLGLRTKGGAMAVNRATSVSAYETSLQTVASSWREIFRNATSRAFTTLPEQDTIANADAVPANVRLASSDGRYKAASATPADFPSLAGLDPGTQPRTGSANPIPMGLSGDHAFAVYTANPSFDLRVALKDLNKAVGADPFNITAKDLDGSLIQHFAFDDDGDTTKGGVAKTRTLDLAVNGPRKGWVIFETKGGGDLRIETISPPGELVFFKQVFLAGPNLNTGGTLPVQVSLQTAGGTLTALTNANNGIQTIHVRDDDGRVQSIKLEKTKVKVPLNLTKGHYVITSPNGTVQLAIPDGLFAFTANSFTPPQNVPVQAGPSSLRVTNTIRGNTNLWTHVKGGTLDVAFTKEDLNFANNDDNLTVVLTNWKGETFATVQAPDDGNLGNKSSPSVLQTLRIQKSGLPDGSYRLELKGSGDYKIREIAINQEKLVAESLFLLGYNSCCTKTQPIDTGINIYYGQVKVGDLKVSTPHKQGFQTISAYARDALMPFSQIKLDTTGTKYTIPLPSGPVRLEVPAQDVSFTGPGYFSFTPDSFFFPFRNEIATFKPDAKHLRANADVVLFDTRGYDHLFDPALTGYKWTGPNQLLIDDPKRNLQIKMEPGEHRITLTNGSLSLSIPDGFFRFGDGPVGIPKQPPIIERDGDFTLRNTVRGNHKFWTYVQDGILQLNLTKQDLNWYNDEDSLNVTITDVQGTEVGRFVIGGDGDAKNTSKAGPSQSAEIEIDNLTTGSYRIALTGSGDYLIQEIRVNQPKFVAETLFLIGNHPCCVKAPPQDNGLNVYYDSLRPGNLDAITGHKNALQTIDIVSPGATDPVGKLVLNETNKKVSTERPRREPVCLNVPLQDVTLTGPGYFSFSPDSFFFPYLYDVVPWKNDPEYLKANADYIILPNIDYTPPTKGEDDKLHWSHTWKASELDLKDGKVKLFLQITNFNKKGFENRTVELHSVTVTFHPKPIAEQPAFIRFLHRLFD